MNIDDIIENAQLKGRVIALDAEVKCLEAVIRAHERVDCLSVTSLKKQLVEAEAENARLQAEVADLKSTADRFKAEVERLRKLGTEMGKHLPDTDAANRAYIDFEAGGKS
jgi:predicted RNase H-like nuclease (RuvC/YqgF family)